MLNKNPKYTDALNDKEGLIQKDTAMEMKKWASKVKRTIKEGGRRKNINLAYTFVLVSKGHNPWSIQDENK